MSSTASEGVLEAGSAPASRAAFEQRFDRLLAANGPALARLAASYTNSAGDRDDLLQEIALAVWQALPGFREECSERTFVFRIAHNRAITALARHRSRRDTPQPGPIECPDPRPGPEAGLAESQQRRRLQQAVRQLPVPFRQVVTLALEEMDYTEIAQVLGISESNVGARLTRARQMLRKLLEDQK
jgi:RNA polymerase sigma-70 factor (ECF subfamily)